MTTHDREKIIAAVKEAGFSEKQWSAMVCQSGPYEINTPTICLTDFYAIAFEAGRESLRQQLSDQREAFAVIAETPVSGEQDDITMEAKDRIAKAIRAWEPK